MDIPNLLIELALGGVLALWIAYLIMTLKNYTGTPKLLDVKIDLRDFPMVSVILPTRNESERVEGCIRSLKNQTYPNFEVIIVDDSTDDTVDIIKNLVGDDNRFRIVKQEKLPKGWIGKSYAMQQGSKLARGKWLLMVDADIEIHPDTIAKAVSYAEKENVELVSLIPHLVCKSFWEKVVQPIVGGLVLFVCPPFLVNNARSKLALAMGAFILIKKDAFERVGGYKRIRDKITDDVEISRLLKREGYGVRLLNGQDMMHVRMYRNLREIWEGWGKNIFLGLTYIWNIRSRLLSFATAIFGSLAIFLFISFPTLTLVTSLLWFLFGTSIPRDIFYLSTTTWLFSFGTQLLAHLLFKGQPRYAILAFLGGIVVSLIFLHSGFKVLLKKGVTWKGRAYYGE
ncbi:MAG: glycosyltransferase [Thermoplasmata archaeon]|nr:MAG: glycosyltransferase [Thermoplasmata archaeon]